MFSLDEVEPHAAAAAAAPASKVSNVAGALGDLRWGMSKDEVLKLLKRRIQNEFQAQVKQERDAVRQDALYQESIERFRRVTQGYVVFDTRKNGWDVSPVADEFRRGTDESMLMVDDPAARDLYFFIRGRLWKWYRELKPGRALGNDFDQAIEVFRAQLGPAEAKKQTRSEGGEAFPGLSWSDPNTRVTLIRRGPDTCIIFEDKATLLELAHLRANAVPRGDKNANSVLDTVVLSDSQKEAWKRDDPRVTRNNEGARAPTPRLAP